MSDVSITCTVNGESVTLEGHPMARLLDALRGQLRLTGTKEGCGEGECGACSVIVNGELVNSCLMPLLHAEGTTIQTIEDELDPRGTLSPGKQGAWHSIRRVLDTVAHNG